MSLSLRQLRSSQDPLSDILLLVLKVGLFGALFLPLVVGSKFFFPFIVLKNVIFHMVIEVLLVVYAALALRNPRFRPRWNPLTVAVLCYFGIVTVTSLSGIDPFWSTWGNYERMGGLFMQWHMAAYFFILVNLLRRWEDATELMTFSIFVSMLMTIFSFGQWLQVPFLLSSSGGARLTGTIGNATYLAAYLLFHLFLLGYFLWREKEFRLSFFFWSMIGMDIVLVGYDAMSRFEANTTSLFVQLWGAPRLLALIVFLHGVTITAWVFRRTGWVVRFFLAGLAFFNFFIFYQTQTRGAIVGLLSGVLLLAGAVAVLRRKTIGGKISIGLIGLGLLAPVLLFLAKDTVFVKSDLTLTRLASISLQDVTSQSRYDTWKAGFLGWAEEPVRFIIGYGQENFSQVFSIHFPSRIFKDLGSQIWFDRAHNIIIDVAVTSGLVGLMSYLAIFAVAAWMLWGYYRRTKDIVGATVPFALLCAYFIQNLFVFDTLDSFILFYLILAAVVCRVVGEPKKISSIAWEHPRPYTTAHAGALIGLSAVMLLVLYIFNYQLLVANHKIYQALLTFQQADPGKQRALFKESIAGSWTGRFEARQQYATYVLNLTRNEAVSSEVVRPMLEEALQELRKSVDEEPNYIRNHLYFASVANRAQAMIDGAAKQVIEVLEPVTGLSPTRPQVWFELGQAYLMTGNAERGLELYRQGLEHSWRVLESHIDMAVAYFLTNQPDEAMNEISIIKRDIQPNIPAEQYIRAIRAAQRGASQYALVAKLYQELLEDNPPKSEWYAQLAATYAKAGDKPRALAAAQRALELDPSVQAEYNAFLKMFQETE